MTKIRKLEKSRYSVEKAGRIVGHIVHVKAGDEWPDVNHWALKHEGGRIDRHDLLANAKSDALRI
jgi:hypothetical protein